MTRPREAACRPDLGFTLIELLVALVVMGLLAGIVVIGLTAFRSDASRQACRAEVKNVATATEAYSSSTGGYAGVTVDSLHSLGYLHSLPENVISIDGTTGAVTSPACP